jgi:putative addiction module component (TIGR02574 family)
MPLRSIQHPEPAEEAMSTPAQMIGTDAPYFRKLESEVMSLPAALRAQLATQLLDSLDEDPEDHVARSWNEEANRRWLAYKRGEIDAMSEEESIADLEERLRRCG